MINFESVKAWTGTFSVKVIDVATGKVIDTLEEKNLVVTLGQTNFAKLIGGDAAGKKISKIALGTNGTAPALTDTTITGAFVKTIDSADYPDVNSVRFNWSIDAGDANGLNINEFGLLNDDGTLCARKVRSTIIKTSAVRLVGTWKITIN